MIVLGATGRMGATQHLLDIEREGDDSTYRCSWYEENREKVMCSARLRFEKY